MSNIGLLSLISSQFYFQMYSRKYECHAQKFGLDIEIEIILKSAVAYHYEVALKHIPRYLVSYTLRQCSRILYSNSFH